MPDVFFTFKCNFPVACSHDRAWEYFAESIINPIGFPSLRCSNYESFTNGTCFEEFAYAKEQKIQFMGLGVNKQYVAILISLFLYI